MYYFRNEFYQIRHLIYRYISDPALRTNCFYALILEVEGLGIFASLVYQKTGPQSLLPSSPFSLMTHLLGRPVHWYHWFIGSPEVSFF